MKARYLISLVMIVLLLLVALKMYGIADGPTPLTRADALKEQVFPADLQAITLPGNPSESADMYYEAALRLYADQGDVLPKTREHDALVYKLVDLLLEAAANEGVTTWGIDRHIPVAIGAGPDYGEALEDIYTWSIEHAAWLYLHGEKDRARNLALAVWVFGHRLFEHCDRLYHRVTGLDMMESAGILLYEMSVKDERIHGEDLRRWSEAITGIRRAWQPKLELMLGIDPHHGDLVNLALNDEDRMFRVEATLRLGIHRYQANRGNRRAMNRAIQTAIESNDAMLTEAGWAADAMTLQEKRRLY